MITEPTRHLSFEFEYCLRRDAEGFDQDLALSFEGRKLLGDGGNIGVLYT